MKTSLAPILLGHKTADFIELSGLARCIDGSGYCLSVTLATNGFACQSRQLFFEDLAGFVQALKNMVDRRAGSAVLSHSQQAQMVRFGFTKTGDILVSGLLVEQAQIANRLEFSVRCDAQGLPAALETFKLAVERLA